jgi:hypothetical protein
LVYDVAGLIGRQGGGRLAVDRRRAMTSAERDANRVEWRGHVAGYRASGLSAAAYCREHELSVWKLRYWAQRIAELDGEGASGFAQVSTPGSGLRLSLPGGLCLEVEPGFDGATLRQFLQAISPAC